MMLSIYLNNNSLNFNIFHINVILLARTNLRIKENTSLPCYEKAGPTEVKSPVTRREDIL